MSNSIKTNEKTSFFTRNKVFFISAAAFLIYYFCYILSETAYSINDVVYEYFSTSFSTFGLVSKVLPGSIYNLLVGNSDEKTATIYGMGLAVIFILLVCVFIQKFWNVAKPYKTKTKVLFLLLFTAGPCAFGWFLFFYGCMDMHWMILFMIAYILSESRVLRWVTPLFFVGMLFVHNGAILCAAPLLCLIFLLRAASADNKYDKISFAVLFALGVVCALGTFGYFAVYDTQNIKFDPLSEMDNWFEANGVKSTEFYDWAFFPNAYAQQQRTEIGFDFPQWYFRDLGNGFANAGLAVLRQVYYNLHTTNFDLYIPVFFITLPVHIINYSVIGSYIKENSSKLKKFIGVCIIALSVLNIFTFVFFSNDIIRWIAHALIISFAGIMAIAKFDNIKVLDKYENILSRFNNFEIIAYMTVYVVGMM